jgi:hypothetical protein
MAVGPKYIFPFKVYMKDCTLMRFHDNHLKQQNKMLLIFNGELITNIIKFDFENKGWVLYYFKVRSPQ